MVPRGIERARQVLRGYAWLIIVPREMADRLGGVDAMRGTGAFVEVEQLAGGGMWLRGHPLLVHADAHA